MFTSVAAVGRAYADAWSDRVAFVGIHLALRLLAYALIAPLLAGLINLTVSMSSQSALTDQDIARFLLTPGGFAVSVMVLGILLLSEVLGFALMSALHRAEARGLLRAARAAAVLVLRRGPALLGVALLLVLRVLVLSLPFGLAGLFVAARFLSEYDINYYLSNRPPEAVAAGLVIAVLVIALVLLLLSRLSGWAVALHLVLFEDTSPWRAFSTSMERMRGRRLRFQREVVIWAVIRLGLIALAAVCAGLLLRLAPLGEGASLRPVLILSVLVTGLWILAGEIIVAMSLGALAVLVGSYYGAPAGAADLGRLDLAGSVADDRAGARRALILAAGGVGALVVAGFWIGAELLDNIRSDDDVTIIAHRGAAGSRPENTLASVRKAIEDGTDWVEIDVQETADGRVVVVHDSDFMKLAGVNLKIWDATMSDLAEIDIGSWFDAAYADERPPLLSDVLELAKGRARVLIELKYYGHDVDLENRVVQIVESAGMTGQIATMSLKYPAVQKMLKLRPDWRTGVLAATAVGNLAGLEGDFVAVSTSTASSGLVRRIDAAGKDLYVWTVNDPLEMSKMISMGADGLITDEPALARKVLEIRAGLSTPERLMLWLTQELGLSLNTRAYRDDQP